METDLGVEMRKLAETHKLGLELKSKADAFDNASVGFYSEPQTVNVKTFIGTWARARRLWSDCSGEPLV